jgi:tryptophanyl-tRNA synthetase
MSKSYGNTILLTDPEPVVRQKLKTMVTDPARIRRSDPGNPDICPVGDLHKLFSKKYEEDPRLAWDILETGSAKARGVAAATMTEVREAMGLSLQYEAPGNTTAAR